MRKITIPKTDLEVSVLCLGVAEHGTRISEEDSFARLDQFFAGGGNFFDTAHIYAAWVPGGGGVPERLLGRWIASRRNREQIVVATKGGHPHLESMQVSRLSRKDILQDLEESLERLNLEQVDLYWLHRDDPSRPIADIVETLQFAISTEKIRFFGVSNWSTTRIMELLEYMESQKLKGFCGSQVGWSLAVRNSDVGGDTTIRFMDAEMLEFHQRSGVFVAGYSSQANGFFGGAYGRNIEHPTPPSSRVVVRSYYNTQNFGRLERAQKLAERYGTDANSIAIASLTSQTFPACAIASCPTETYLRTTLAAGDVLLSPADLSYLTQETPE